MSFNWKLFIFTLSFFFFSLYLPLAFLVYTPLAYDVNYELNGAYAFIAEENAMSVTENLIGYFLYKNNLNNELWSERERLHMEDVRVLYTVLFFIGVLSFYLLMRLLTKEYLRKASQWNLGVLLGLGILFYFVDFTYFWDRVFHPLLFSGNNYWVFGKEEISYILFPYGFFKIGIVFIGGIAMMIQVQSFLCSFPNNPFSRFQGKKNKFLQNDY